MSVAKGIAGADGSAAGEKIVLSRDPGTMWRQIEERWAGQNQFDWQSLAMLHLLVGCRWRVTMIARAFGLHKGQASRRIHACLLSLADQFEMEKTDFFNGKLPEDLPPDGYNEDGFDSPIPAADYE